MGLHCTLIDNRMTYTIKCSKIVQWNNLLTLTVPLAVLIVLWCCLLSVRVQIPGKTVCNLLTKYFIIIGFYQLRKSCYQKISKSKSDSNICHHMFWIAGYWALMHSLTRAGVKHRVDLSKVHNANSPNHSRRKWLRDVVRNDCSVNFHLSKLSIAKLSILCDISLVRDWKRKLKLITLGSEEKIEIKKEKEKIQKKSWKKVSLLFSLSNF